MSIAGCLVVPIGGSGVGSVVIESEGPVVSGAAAVAAFAAGLAPRLALVVNLLEGRHRALPPETSPDFPKEARQLVEEGEVRVLELLDDRELAAGLEGGTDELAPLRDYVRAAAAAALTELSEPRLTRGTLGLAPAVARGVRSDPRQVQRRDQSAGVVVERFLDAVSGLWRRADRSELRTSFCALSQPPRGRFVLYPASAEDRQDEVFAASTIANLWRGTYRYTVTLGGETIRRENLNLMDPERLTLECSIERGEIACRTFDVRRPGCPS
jgi:hypothetical protein